MNVDVNPSSVLNPEIKSMMEESFASELGVHSQDIEVIYDPETNEAATYTITSADATPRLMEPIFYVQIQAPFDCNGANIERHGPKPGAPFEVKFFFLFFIPISILFVAILRLAVVTSDLKSTTATATLNLWENFSSEGFSFFFVLITIKF